MSAKSITKKKADFLMAKNTVSKQALFETVPAPKALMTMAIPTVISQLINLVYNMVDAIFIGMTGDPYKTAAATLAFTIFMMTVSLANLFGIGGGSLMARLIGKGENDKAKAVCAFSFYGAIAISLLYSLIIGLFLEPILWFLGASEQTLPFAKQYIWLVVIVGNLPNILANVIAHLLRNTGYSRQASFGLSLGGVLNIALDPLFMFVLLPSGMEVVGAALATLIANVVSCVYLLIVQARLTGKAPVSMRPRDMRMLEKAELKAIFAVGVPSAILTALADVANMVLNFLMAAHGDLELAAVGIVIKASRLPNAINIGICQGMLPIVAYNYSSGNHKRMDDVIRTARISGLVIAVVTLVLYEIFALPICKVFLIAKQENAVEALATVTMAATFLRLRSIASVPQFLNYNTSFCMQAMGNGTGTLLHACMRELVFYVPFMYLFDSLFGTNALAGAQIAGELCGAVFALVYFTQWKRRHLHRLAQK